MTKRESSPGSPGSAAAAPRSGDYAKQQTASLLKSIFAKSREAPRQEELVHDGNNASIILDEQLERQTPWTPKSLGRAKTAIIYKHTLNDKLLVLERSIFFFSEWVPYFVSLQDEHALLFKSRERWEQGLKPDKVVTLHHMMCLGDMKVEVTDGDASSTEPSHRLFHRKLLETSELDELVNSDVRQTPPPDITAPESVFANAHCVLEFGSHNQSTFELWSKAIRHTLKIKREQHAQSNTSNKQAYPDSSELDNNVTFFESASQSAWVSPGHDSKLTLHQSEIWCHRVLSGEKEKAESELRRIIAMEKLVAQVTNPRMALLVYEKVSRVHELFIANSRREMEALDGRETPIRADILNFFADHLKRKYSVFLILALAYGVDEEQIREAHESMCRENSAEKAGVGGGIGEGDRSVDAYGFNDPESVDLYEKYRDAALNYHKMNYGDIAAAEEEDAIMHLPVMLQVAVVRQDREESQAMLSILDAVKARLVEHCTGQENDL